MNRTVFWLSEAEADLLEAIAFYGQISPDLGKRFTDAVIATVKAITESPFRFPVLGKERHRAGVRRFPYGLIYTIEAERLVILACFHGKRNPARWQQRQ